MMKEAPTTPPGVIMAIAASGIWVFWCLLGVLVLPPPHKLVAATIGVLMFFLTRGIALGRMWARWTAFSILAILGLAQGVIVTGMAVSILRPTGPKPISASPISLVIPLILAALCLTAASFLLRRREAAHFEQPKTPRTSNNDTEEI